MRPAVPYCSSQMLPFLCILHHTQLLQTELIVVMTCLFGFFVILIVVSSLKSLNFASFDEFNRIELPVLSVVAQQVLAITNAKRSHAPAFTFPGDSQEIRLNNHVGYFITMNPVS